MNRIIVGLNAIAITLVAGVVGYMTFDSGFLPTFSEPDDTWFRSAVLESRKPVLVKFGAHWCRPCCMLDPELDRLAKSGLVAVVKVDIQRNPSLAQHYRVSSIPDMFLFRKGSVVARRVGYADYNQLRGWVSRYVSN